MKRLILTGGLILARFFIIAQCATIDLELNGSTTVCQEGTWDDSTIQITGCWEQATDQTAFIAFQSDGWNVTSIIVEGGFFYPFAPNEIVWTHLGVYEDNNGCVGAEVFSSNTGCNNNPMFTNQYAFDYTPFWDGYWWDDSYVLNLDLPEGDYIVMVGAMISSGDQPTPLEGCSMITIVNIPPLGLSVWENYCENGGRLPYKIWVIQNYTLDGRCK